MSTYQLVLQWFDKFNISKKFKRTTVIFNQVIVNLDDDSTALYQLLNGSTILQSDELPLPTKVRGKFKVVSVMIQKDESECVQIVQTLQSPLDLNVISDTARADMGWFQIELKDKETESTLIFRSRHLSSNKSAEEIHDYFRQFA